MEPRLNDVFFITKVCKQCAGGSELTPEDKHGCADKHPTTEPILRSIDLLGVTAGDLQKTMVQAGVDNPLEYPTLVDEMMSIIFAFCVKWQKEFVLCSVLECKDSKVLVDKI
ncbi:hypothetical protein QL285_083942 [Trifolium repens]|nr:hypothetical protein QL285_083942 [Trifolium repens]